MLEYEPFSFDLVFQAIKNFIAFVKEKNTECFCIINDVKLSASPESVKKNPEFLFHYYDGYVQGRYDEHQKHI